MSTNAPDFYSHKYELKLNGKTAKASDRTSWRFLLPGIVFGSLLLLLGICELFIGLDYTNPNVAQIIPLEEHVAIDPLITPVFFDIVFMIVGLGMIAAGVFSYLQYRKYIYDGKRVYIGLRSALGNKKIFEENIKNYQGVRFRIEFYQCGFITANKYIIELYHKDPNKIVPLYISTSPQGVRKKWKDYARYFKLPAVVNTDEGLIKRDLKNLNKSIQEMSKLGFVVDEYDSYEPLPNSIKYVRRRDKIVIKCKRIWDVYNLLAWFAIVMASGLIFIMLPKINVLRQDAPLLFYSVATIVALAIVMAIFILFRREKLVLKKNKIVNTHKYMFFSTKHDEMMKNDIEAIEVSENPATGRFFVSIISEDKTIAFGKKLCVDELRWIKRFLIHEVIK